MHINKIRLVNFRGMKDLTVEFAPGINVIIGDNGAGKTLLLSNLSRFYEHLKNKEIP